MLETSARALAVFLVALLTVMGGPAAAIVHAAEEGSEAPAPEEVQEDAPVEEAEEEAPAEESEAAAEDASDTTSETDTGAEGTDGTEGSDGTESEEGDSTEDTESGDEADAPDDDSTDVPQGDGEATVETGDIDVDANVGNESNTNVTDTENDGDGTDSDDSGSTEEGDGGAGDTDESDDTASTTASTTVSIDTDIEADNDATTTNDVVLDGNSGTNTASAGGGASVDTGDVMASANVVNVVNTNIVNSTGMLYFLNLLFGQSSLDLRNLFTVFSDEEGTGDPRCSFDACDESDVDFSSQADNVAAVDNDVVVRAQSGENEAAANEGDATVSTGNAYASANVVNVVNTNIVDANYLLLSVNNFGSFANDIVFPGADFFSDIFSSSAAVFGEGATASIENDNTAGIDNSVDGEANTGDNEASSDTGAAAIATGDGTVAASVTNIANQNFLGDSLTFLFRVHGDWSGDVFGLPEGLTWSETDQGIAITLDPGAAAAAGGGTALAGAGDTYAIANSNDAQVTNNVSVYALTGDNKASSIAGDAFVETGDAYAAANILNIANTNVVGRNWTYAIFNIFGDWDGDITFGQPDLWVGARAEVPHNLSAGSCFAYEVTVNNFGDADARSVVLNTAFDRAFQQFGDFDEDFDDYLQWDVGTVLSGGSKTISLPVCLSNGAGGGVTLTTDFEVESSQDDFNDEDNYEQISVVTMRSDSSGSSALRLGNAEIDIEKTASVDETSASSTVTYTIVLTNTGDPVYHALLIDTIEDENGHVIHEQRWGLDTVYPDEEIIISYDVFYSASTTPGDYTNYAFLSGVEKHPNYEKNYGNMIDSPIAQSVVEITALDELVALEDALFCEPYLTEYIRFGDTNSQSEVEKLQAFLIEYENAENIDITGYYDATTYEAVHDFQDKYASDVLTPWGATESTGFVYYTTQKKINDIYCAGEREFPLSGDQLEEIEDYRERIRAYQAAEVEVPEPVLREIGQADDTSDDESTELAAATKPEPAIREEDTDTQTAAAATALSEEDAAGLYEALRDRLETFFGWLSFGEDKDGKEVSVR